MEPIGGSCGKIAIALTTRPRVGVLSETAVYNNRRQHHMSKR